ncbi:hypothetical protein GCM10025771_31420 [Niveibacterium umoris]|uniref:Uncharacterized protein n=1 Tax=Niveibacterium umoris TaxID=1193620 RepID=A0A840BJ90_9RHOO|nr:hypothetical protein [Niveibacterium umoris]MBB4011662.1 hypothetical protein [Niveibacterium umoris]
MTLTVGKLLKAFYADPLYWPADETGRAHAGERIVVNGVVQNDRATEEIIDALRDEDVVEVIGGEVWGGGIDVNDEPTFEALLDRWLRAHANTP